MKRLKIFIFNIACIFFLSSCNVKYEYNNPSSYDDSEYTRESAGIHLQDDFYGYTNFDFLWNSSIPADTQEYSIPGMTGKSIESFLSDKIISVAGSNAIYPADSDEYKIGSFYLQYLDQKRRETVGLAPLSDGLNAIKKTDNIRDFISVCGLLYRDYGCTVLFSPSVSADYYNSSIYTLYIRQMDLVSSAKDLLETKDCAEDQQQIISALLETYGYENSDRSAYDIMTIIPLSIMSGYLTTLLKLLKMIRKFMASG